jgi:hypothetical protein
MSRNPSIDALLNKIRMNSVQFINRHIKNHLYYKNYSKYLAPHTSGPRDVPRCGALSLLQKDAALQGGIQQKPL